MVKAGNYAFLLEEFHCYAIGYNTPDEYYRKYKAGELEKKDTFSKRILTEEPKFVQKKRVKKQETS